MLTCSIVRGKSKNARAHFPAANLSSMSFKGIFPGLNSMLSLFFKSFIPRIGANIKSLKIAESIEFTLFFYQLNERIIQKKNSLFQSKL